jgi:ankyrin repeat protein
MFLFFNNDKEIKLNTIQISLVNKIIENNLAEFVYFAEQGKLNLNFQDSCGNSLLHFAASCQNNDIVNLLLDKNVDPNQVNNENVVPLELYYAVETKAFERLASLTNRKTILKLTSYSDKLQRQLFWYAEHIIAQNRISSLEKLLQAGFDINIRDLEDNGNTLLHKAAIYKNLEIMNYLIEKNAIPNIENNVGHIAQDYIEKPELIVISTDLVDKPLNHEIDPFAIKKKSEEIILKAGGKILDWLPTIDLTTPRPLSEIIDRALVLNAIYQLCLKAPKNVIANWLSENDLIDNLSPDEYSLLTRYDVNRP